MRIRNKPWAKEELNASKFYVKNPEELKTDIDMEGFSIQKITAKYLKRNW